MRPPRPASRVTTPPSARLLPLAVSLGMYALLCLLLRAALFWDFGRGEGATTIEAVAVFLTGLRMDLTVGLAALAPVSLWLLMVPERLFTARSHRLLVHAGLVLGLSLLPFTLAIEFFFFDEFDARFNTVAVDYLLYPYEVAGNIRESYPVGLVVAACAATGLVLWACVRRAVDAAWSRPSPWPERLRDVSVVIGLTLGGLLLVHADNPRQYGTRVLDEIADNGVHAFVHAALTRDLDYGAHYTLLPRADAWARTRRMVGGDAASFATRSSLERDVAGDPGRPRLNVVIVLEESLGSEFWGSLGRAGASCTPEMDALSARGTLLTRMHATGNRTVRGMEGVLSSFPPLPGDSIVRRPHSQHVETIARVLRRDGYQSAFVYGGRGVFDGMRAFTTANGFDRFIEETDFVDPVHSTIWGVSDEDLFDRCLAEMQAMRADGRPFLLTALTVSNHKPFTFPAGRIDPPEGMRRREKAVMYADWAVARFVRQAEALGFLDDTIIAVVADHGARVYGSQDIPMRSYEIPLVVFGPDGVVPRGRRVAAPGSSMDVAPTILGLIGRPHRTVFFGRDLLAPGAEDSAGIVPLHHDRDVGLVRAQRLAVLSLGDGAEVYGVDPRGLQDRRPLPGHAPADDELVRDAEAVFQVADEVYTSGRYHVAGEAP